MDCDPESWLREEDIKFCVFALCYTDLCHPRLSCATRLFQNCRAEWGALPRESACLGEGQLRRWQADSLRESDGLRIEKMCDDLRRRRRGKAGGSDKGGKPR